MDNFIGIDVAKATLQVYIPEIKLDIEFSNTTTGLNNLYKKIKKSYKNDYPTLCACFYTQAQKIVINQRCYCMKTMLIL